MTRKGKRVYVILRDGERLVAKFVEPNRYKLVLDTDTGRREIPWRQVRSFGIWRAPTVTR